MHSSHALQSMADGLPALGIVAAVLGVIKTMGSIDQPPEVLGKMIGGALVGTFSGRLSCLRPDGAICVPREGRGRGGRAFLSADSRGSGCEPAQAPGKHLYRGWPAEYAASRPGRPSVTLKKRFARSSRMRHEGFAVLPLRSGLSLPRCSICRGSPCQWWRT